MMKILLSSPLGGNAGGIAKWTRHILDYYNTYSAPDIRLILSNSRRSQGIFSNTSLPKRIYLGIKDNLQYIHKFKKELSSDTYDIVHIASSASLGLFKDLQMIRITHKKGIKIVIHFHFGRIPDIYRKKGSWEHRLIEEVISKADRVIVLDQKSYYVLKQNGHNNIDILPNPVSDNVISLSTSFDHDIERRHILFAGHVVTNKGVLELVEATKDLKNVHVEMMGAVNEEMKSKLLKVAGKNNDWLLIKGECKYEDVIAAMCKTDLFVLPTYSEGFPNVILEAMACSCAIITTPVGAIPQMLEDDENGKYGILVPPKDTDALKRAILDLIDNDDAKSKMRENVRHRVVERYSISSVWTQMVSIWEKTIKQYPPNNEHIQR